MAADPVQYLSPPQQRRRQTAAVLCLVLTTVAGAVAYQTWMRPALDTRIANDRVTNERLAFLLDGQYDADISVSEGYYPGGRQTRPVQMIHVDGLLRQDCHLDKVAVLLICRDRPSIPLEGGANHLNEVRVELRHSH